MSDRCTATIAPSLGVLFRSHHFFQHLLAISMLRLGSGLPGDAKGFVSEVRMPPGLSVLGALRSKGNSHFGGLQWMNGPWTVRSNVSFPTPSLWATSFRVSGAATQPISSLEEGGDRRNDLGVAT